MGVTGLLKALELVQRPTHLSEYDGTTAAVDVSSWLHRGAYMCSLELLKNGVPDALLEYCIDYTRLLISHNIKPLLVFDGCPTGVKALENETRKLRRTEALQKAKHFLNQGLSDKAVKYARQGVTITSALTYALIKRLRSIGIKFLVAPYEADAQLAYLSMNKIVDLVISEDSDTLAYGCSKVLFKLQKCGSCVEIIWDSLSSAALLPTHLFSLDSLQIICILCGCDYAKNIKGVGIKRACQLAKKHSANLVAILNELKCCYGDKLPIGYANTVRLAMLSYKHQTIFNREFKVDSLTKIPAELPEHLSKAIGPKIDDDTAKLIALGYLDPRSHRPYDDLPVVDSLLRNYNDLYTYFVFDEGKKKCSVRDEPPCSSILNEVSDADAWAIQKSEESLKDTSSSTTYALSAQNVQHIEAYPKWNTTTQSVANENIVSNAIANDFEFDEILALVEANLPDDTGVESAEKVPSVNTNPSGSSPHLPICSRKLENAVHKDDFSFRSSFPILANDSSSPALIVEAFKTKLATKFEAFDKVENDASSCPSVTVSMTATASYDATQVEPTLIKGDLVSKGSTITEKPELTLDDAVATTETATYNPSFELTLDDAAATAETPKYNPNFSSENGALRMSPNQIEANRNRTPVECFKSLDAFRLPVASTLYSTPKSKSYYKAPSRRHNLKKKYSNGLLSKEKKEEVLITKFFPVMNAAATSKRASKYKFGGKTLGSVVLSPFKTSFTKC